MNENIIEPEPMEIATSDRNSLRDHQNNIIEDAERRRIHVKSIHEEKRKQTIMASGKRFITVFGKLLVETNADRNDRLLYMQRVCHSIFFFGHINLPQIKPREFIPATSWKAFEQKFQKPLQEYNTHLPRQTPYSILLEYITKIYGKNRESVLEELEKRNKDLLSDENQLTAKDFALSASVIAQSCVEDTGSKNVITAYGASVAYKGKVPRRVMIAISSLFVWDKIISYSVSCGNNGLGIYFPNCVICCAYKFDTFSLEFKKIPPCIKCAKMFIVNFDPEYVKTNKQEDWRYGNCAEAESLSNLLHDNMDLGNKVYTLNINGETLNRETIIERFTAEYNCSLKNQLKNLLVSRKFDVPLNNWALFTPDNHAQD